MNYTGYALGTAYAVSVAEVDSTGGGSVDALYDALTTNEWNSNTSGTTHWVKLTLPRPVWVAGLRLYLSSSGLANWDNCAVYVSVQNRNYGDDWGTAVFSGDLSPDGADQWNEVSFAESWGRYILIVATVVAGQAIYAKEIDVYILSIVSEQSTLPVGETLLAAGTRFYIDIGDGAGNPYGPGPIISAHYWRSTRRVDRVGAFEFAMPLADDKATWVQVRRYARCYAITDDGIFFVGSGIIDRIDKVIDRDGNVNLVVGGDDVMRELAWRSVEYLQLRSGTSPVTHAVAAGLLSLELPSEWTVEAAPSPTNDDIYYFFRGESALAAALQIADASRVHVWMSADQTLTFTNTWTDSGLRAIEAPTNPNLASDDICLIGSLSVISETYDLISRILPWGAEIPGLSGSYVSLFNATKSAPLGYTLSTADKYIKNDSTELTYGHVEAFVKYNDIEAASSSAADLESAANQLFDIALYDLQRRSQPNTQYRLTLAYAPVIITPMQTIRCVFRRVVGDQTIMTVDENLYIMATTTVVDADGLRTTELEVVNVDRWPETDSDPIRKSAKDNLRIQ